MTVAGWAKLKPHSRRRGALGRVSSKKLQPIDMWLKGPDIDEYRQVNSRRACATFTRRETSSSSTADPSIFGARITAADFPLTGYPPTDVKSLAGTLFKICKGIGASTTCAFIPGVHQKRRSKPQIKSVLPQPEPGMWNEISPDTRDGKMLIKKLIGMNQGAMRTILRSCCCRPATNRKASGKSPAQNGLIAIVKEGSAPALCHRHRPYGTRIAEHHSRH